MSVADDTLSEIIKFDLIYIIVARRKSRQSIKRLSYRIFLVL